MNERLARALGTVRAQEAAALDAAARLRRARHVLARAKAERNRTAVLRAERELSLRRERLAATRDELDTRRLELDRLRGTLIDVRPGSEIDRLAGKHPIVLLPVRLETRFMKEALVIRIFPDDLHVDQHDEALTEEEIARYRDALGNDDIDEEAVRRRVFDALSGASSAPRAAWVLRRLRERPDDKPREAGTDVDRIARAAALPDRFVAIGLRDGKQVFVEAGGLVPEHLPLGPDPTVDVDEAERVDPDTALSDPGLLWMRDLEAAEARGLAIRVRYRDSEGLETKGVDELVVLGVRSGLDPEDGVASLETLFAAHRYGTGLGIVEQGTPTNDTATAASGFERDLVDVDAEVAAADDVRFARPDGSNDERLAAAFGITDEAARRELFGRLENAALHEQGQARAMNTVLWSVTGGYFLEQLMRPLGGRFERSDLERIDAIRRHFVAHVRGRGPVPAFRVGEQPYGVLPVVALARWTSSDGEDDELDRRAVDLLGRLRRFWERASGKVPRVATGDDPEESVLRLLGLQAVSDRFRVHPLLGPAFLKNLLLQFGEGDRKTRLGSAMFGETRRRLSTLLGQLGLSLADPLLGECTHALCDYAISNELAQRGIEDNLEALDPHYIAWLLDAPLDDIEAERGAGAIDAERGVPLLYLLLRHAVLLELADTARRRVSLIDPSVLGIREPELIDVARVPIDRSPGTRLAANALELLKRPGVGNDTRPIGQTILDELRRADPPASLPLRLSAFWNALRVLSNLSAENLDELTRETLDLFSSRYDAWATSFASKRLERLDASTGGGRWIGAWGYVEDLRPRRRRDSEGYLHAPSLNQAATAAVLYNGFLTHTDTDGESPLDLRLDSSRVREADALVDGLRQGVSLASLLGYRFERHLQEERLQVHGLAFRRAFPGIDELHGDGVDGSADEPLPPQARVLDGLALVRAFSDEGYAGVRRRIAAVLPDAVPPATGGVARRLQAGLRRLRAQLDALSDALTAESVHQLLLGNPVRAGAALEAMSGSGSPPPELQAMRTPRTGVPITHRVLVTWAPGASGAGELGTLLPGAEDWASTWVQPDARLVFPVVAGDATIDAGPGLDDLELSILDLLFVAANPERDRAWLGARVLRHVAAKRPELGEPDGWRVRFARAADDAPDTVLFDDVEPILIELRNVFGSGRMLGAHDLAATTDAPATPRWRAAAAVARIDAAAKRLARAVRSLEEARERLARNPDVPAARRTLVDALWTLLPFCIAEAVPITAAGAGTDTSATGIDTATPANADPAPGPSASERLLDQAAQVASIGRRRLLGHADTRLDTLPAVVDAEGRDRLLDAVGAVFGAPLPMALPLELERAEIEAIERAWEPGRSDELQNDDPTAADRWLADLAGVRDRLGHFHELRLRHAVTHLAPNPPLRVAQLPPRDEETWIALPQAALSGEFTTSMVAHASAPIERLDGTGLEGWTIDEWQDLIPRSQETTGLAFHVDSPGSHAPNVVLLAVAPDVGANWRLEHLLDTVREATELMRFRGVATRQLDGLGHLLPAIAVPHNADGATVSTDLKRARRAPDP